MFGLVGEKPFEFELGEGEKKVVYVILASGQAVQKVLEGQHIGMYISPRLGIIDFGLMTYFGIHHNELFNGTDEDISHNYELIRSSLKLCQDSANALFRKNESWGINIGKIIDFYQVIKSQSETLLSYASEKFPELNAYRLPEFDTEEILEILKAQHRALFNTLKPKKEAVES